MRKTIFTANRKKLTQQQFLKHLKNFRLNGNGSATQQSVFAKAGKRYPVYINEFWTSKQRQANSLHEVSYRACFKPQLPHFFIGLLTNEGDTVYDPFNGRGTTIIEAALMGRNVAANDVNPLSLMLSEPRINIPELKEVEKRLASIQFEKKLKADIDLSMFYHPDTESEIVSLRHYLKNKRKPDKVDNWIRMVATNRLTGHSKGFFSVYTLPPNQAVSAERQKKINKARKQKPEYRNVKELILRKSKQLLSQIDNETRGKLRQVKCNTYNTDASATKAIADNSIALTVTSPPFLDIVQYASDNWLRCWFNNIDVKQVEKKITMSKTVEDWANKMQQVFNELFRITKKDGTVAFEVGEVHKGKTRLEEVVVDVGLNAGFACSCILINQQQFTKTSNIWGVSNNASGTNSNRIVVFRK
ncbi:MAG: hypothetical protein KIS94_14420 [Chitinophagales bacterium]|nr:hypothetical protein [Chitinophagales bacterium]